MAEYNLFVDSLIDKLLKSDKAVLEYGGIYLKEGIDFFQNGGMEKINDGIDAVDDLLEKAGNTMDKAGRVIDGATENVKKAADFAKSTKSVLGTFMPVMTKSGPTITTATSPLALSSLLGKNAGSFFIRNGDKGEYAGYCVPAIDGKLFKLCRTINTMKNSSCISAGASVLNCGISLVGFAVVVSQLNAMKRQLNSIQAGIIRIEEKLDKALIDRAIVVLDNLMGYMQSLSQPSSGIDSGVAIWKDLNEAGRLIINLTDMACNGSLTGGMVLQLLLPLNISFEKVVKEYSIRTYYKDGALPVNLTSWTQTIDLVAESPLGGSINYFMHIEYPELTEAETSACMRYIMDDLIKVPSLELGHAIEFIKQTGISAQEYYNLPNMIVKRILEREYEIKESTGLLDVFNL